MRKSKKESVSNWGWEMWTGKFSWEIAKPPKPTTDSQRELNSIWLLKYTCLFKKNVSPIKKI